MYFLPQIAVTIIKLHKAKETLVIFLQYFNQIRTFKKKKLKQSWKETQANFGKTQQEIPKTQVKWAPGALLCSE